MNIITGYRAEPHITSAQDRAKNQGAFGVGSYILDVGRMLEAEIISANEIRIMDGVLSHQGCVACIESGTYDTVEISSGSQGMQRIDLIVARYTRDAETNIEDIQIEVIEGTPAASNPTVPSYTDGDIQAGDTPVNMPLYRVNISGITISSCTLVAQKIKTQAEADAAIAALNSKTSTKTGTFTRAQSASTSHIFVRQFGNVVSVNGWIEGLTLSANTDNVIGTISGVTTPPDVIRARGAAGANAYNPNNDAYIGITTSGEVRARVAASGSTVAYFNITYIAN